MTETTHKKPCGGILCRYLGAQVCMCESRAARELADDEAEEEAETETAPPQPEK